MSNLAQEIVAIDIEDELKQSYLDYAMSVIVGRALPDVRDGLKPVHRRVLFAMHELGNDYNKPHKKSARIVGEVIGKYHPHGDVAVYDTIVRMAQPFSLRYVIVDGQGNFGSIDGDSAAAMRYTEIRMSKFAHSLLADLDKDTVDFAPNYDETEFAPIVLPTRLPNLLVNGSSGIAVGMATNIPPHNITEVIDACLHLIDNPQAELEELMQFIKGPDFPTGAIIQGRSGILDAYRTGRGRVLMRSRTHIEQNEKSGKVSIVATELPYQVNKARLIERIAELVRAKKIEGITGLRDESDKDGIRVVVELRRGEVPEVILNQLFIHTALQQVFGVNIVALVDNQPKTLPLKSLIQHFIAHRREVVTRRTRFELRKAKQRAHILEGLLVALANIDAIIVAIKTSQNPEVARNRLIETAWEAGIVVAMLQKAQEEGREIIAAEGYENYGLKNQKYFLSPEQAQAILELRLHRLTGLEQHKIQDEYEGLLKQIQYYLTILNNFSILMGVIKQELIEERTKFSDERRSEISLNEIDVAEEDLITEEDVVVTLSFEGYIKYQPLSVYAAQRRGGRGKSATQLKEEDAIAKLVVASTHDWLLLFSNAGKVYWVKAYQLPLASRQARGRPIVNLLPLSESERISTILPVRDFNASSYVVMATAQGVVKKVALTEFSRPRQTGIIAVDLDEGDELVGADITNGEQEILLFSDAGKVIRFKESDVRAMGRTARGVRGIRLQPENKVISMVVACAGGAILTCTSNGFGKRTAIEDYPVKGRGGQGVISIQTTERNGLVIGAVQVHGNDEMILISDKGTLVRIRAQEVSIVGRNTQGVTLINLQESEHLVGVERVAELELDQEGEPSVGDDIVADINSEDDGTEEPSI